MAGSPTILDDVTTTILSAPAATTTTVAEAEEFYSSWSLFLVCCLLILSLWTSYYLQIKKIRAIHETLVSIFAGMFVGLVVRLAKLEDIQAMLVRRVGCRGVSPVLSGRADV
jgi:sodium/hydrogen exchanger-like protein 6/7